MNKNKKESKILNYIKEHKILISVLSLIVILLITGTTLAIFLISKEGNEKTYTLGNVNVEYFDGDTFEVTNSIPLADYEIEEYAAKKEFSFQNTGDIPIYAEIVLDDIEIDDVLKNDDFRWELYEEKKEDETTAEKEYEKISEGSFKNIDNNSILLKSGIKLESEETSKQYKVLIYIRDNEQDQNNMETASMKAKITVTAKDKPIHLSEAILMSNEIQTQAPNFTENSTDRGLFKIEGENIYYFRGSTITEQTSEEYRPDYEMNNYVYFGTYKNDVTITVDENETQQIAKAGDPILWRVVRINADESIKLISENHTGIKVAFNSREMGYINSDKTPSEAKQEIDNWYSNTIGVDNKLDELVLETEFCNDRSDNYTAVMNRLHKDNEIEPLEPTLNCIRDEDKIRSKAGLITADEAVYTGALVGKQVRNNVSYLYNGIAFWTLSPAGMATQFEIRSGLYSGYRPSAVGSMGVRPVITISSKAKIKGGKGTKEKPYKLFVQ